MPYHKYVHMNCFWHVVQTALRADCMLAKYHVCILRHLGVPLHLCSDPSVQKLQLSTAPACKGAQHRPQVLGLQPGGPNILLQFPLYVMLQCYALCINKCFCVFADHRRFRSVCTQLANTTYDLRALISSCFKVCSLPYEKQE